MSKDSDTREVLGDLIKGMPKISVSYLAKTQSEMLDRIDELSARLDKASKKFEALKQEFANLRTNDEKE